MAQEQSGDDLTAWQTLSMRDDNGQIKLYVDLHKTRPNGTIRLETYSSPHPPHIRHLLVDVQDYYEESGRPMVHSWRQDFSLPLDADFMKTTAIFDQNTKILTILIPSLED